MVTPFERNGTSESRAAQYVGNLSINRGGEHEHVHFFGTKQGALRHAAHLQRRTYRGGSIESPRNGPHRPTVRGSIDGAAVAALGVVGRKLRVDVCVGHAGRPSGGLHLGDGLGEGSEPHVTQGTNQKSGQTGILRTKRGTAAAFGY